MINVYYPTLLLVKSLHFNHHHEEQLSENGNCMALYNSEITSVSNAYKNVQVDKERNVTTRSREHVLVDREEIIDIRFVFSRFSQILLQKKLGGADWNRGKKKGGPLIIYAHKMLIK